MIKSKIRRVRDNAAGATQRIGVKDPPHYAWAILLACSFIHLGLCGILLNASSVYTVPVCESLGIGRGAFSMHNTIRSIASCVALPFSALAYRKVPLRLLVTISAFMSLASSALMSQFTSAYQWSIAGAIQGISGAICVSTLIPTLIGNWFKKGAGLSIAIASAFSGIGGSLFSPIIARLIEVYGWRMSYLMVACGCSLLVFPFSLLVIRLTPKDKGLLPYGASGEDIEASTPKGVPNAEGLRPRTLPIIVYSLSMGCVGLGLGFYQHAPSYAVSIGLPATVGAMLASVIMFGNIVGKLSVGRLLDRFGSRRMGILPVILSFVGIVGIILAGQKNTAMLFISTFFFGAVFCYTAVVTPFSLREMYGTTFFPSVFPIVSMIHTLLGSFGFMIQGYIFDNYGSYIPALYFSLVMYAIGIILFIVVQRMKKWPKYGHPAEA